MMTWTLADKLVSVLLLQDPLLACCSLHSHQRDTVHLHVVDDDH